MIRNEFSFPNPIFSSLFTNILNNIKVFIDPKATMFLIGSEMDYASDKLASRFVFKNPNEKSSCGCGESFSI